jgi:hypothetical protein
MRVMLLGTTIGIPVTRLDKLDGVRRGSQELQLSLLLSTRDAVPEKNWIHSFTNEVWAARIALGEPRHNRLQTA